MTENEKTPEQRAEDARETEAGMAAAERKAKTVKQSKAKTAKRSGGASKTEKRQEHNFDGQRGYTGTQSDYRPPDTDPARQTVNEGRDQK